MLGWEIVVTNKEQKIASWMTGMSGTDWMSDLIKEGKAKDLGSNGGYPDTFLVPAKVLVPILTNGIPQVGGTLVIGEDYAISGNKVWKLDIQIDQLNQCLPEDDLVIEAWDQS